jgi:hypothetical protein
MAAVAQQVTVHPALVPRIERIERGGVARGVGEHQVLVARLGGDCGQGHRPQVWANGFQRGQIRNMRLARAVAERDVGWRVSDPGGDPGGT